MVNIGNIHLEKNSLWLSPMEAVTDPAFRGICKEEGADVLVSEFVSSEALVRNAKKSFFKMRFEPAQRPIAIQIFGYDEQSMRQAAEIAANQHPDFIDINWGCPVRKVVSKGAGSGILKDIPKMISISSAVVRAMEEIHMPVTVKTRLGWDSYSKPIVEVAERLQDIGIAALSIHGRTRAQLYSGEADWTLIGEVKRNPRMFIPIFGNGDVDSPQKASYYLQKFGVDGLLIGRAAIGNPWIFRQIRYFLENGILEDMPTIQQRKEMCLRHLLQEVEDNSERLAVQEMKIHYSGYFKGIANFKPYKVKLMHTSSVEEVEEILDAFIAELEEF
ncbi:MAG: tRNA dihydrouridine synthase DusB [Bacteroidales bacterium]